MAGKEYTIVVLSSSPPVPDVYNSPHYAAPTRRVAMPPSSPFALSPPSSPRKNPPGALTSGSRAIPIPENATRGFATVSSLVRSEHFAQHIDDDFVEVEQVQSRRVSPEGTCEGTAAVKKPRKNATKNATAIPKPRARKPKADKEVDKDTVSHDPELRLPRTTKSPFFEDPSGQRTLEIPTEPAAAAPKLTKSGKPRKPRAKKEKIENGDAEPKPKKTRVTKPKAAAKAGKAQREAADVVSAHFPTNKDQANADVQGKSIWEVSRSPPTRIKSLSKQRPPDLTVEGLDLEEAVTRRRDWTPPRDTVALSPSTNSTGEDEKPMSTDTTNGTFTHLVSNFTYESPTAYATSNVTKAASGVTKRRRVELVDLPANQANLRASSPEKGKAPKKKPRTITDLVTGHYAPKDADTNMQAVTSDFFSSRTSITKVPLNDATASDTKAPQKKPSRQRSKSRDGSEKVESKSRPRARKASTKPPAKPKAVAEKLLSPTSALLRMDRQEVLFGTSSQLALEESPTTVRQIQRAIAESEQDAAGLSQYLLEAPPRWPKLQRVEGKKGLWGESTRDTDGGLLENAESIYIPEPDRTQDLSLLMDSTHEEPSLPTEFVDIDDIRPLAPIAISSDSPTPPRVKPQSQIEVQTPLYNEAPDISFDNIEDFDYGPPPSNQNAESQDSFADIDDFLPVPTAASHHSPLTMPKPPASVPAIASDLPEKRRGRSPKAKSATHAVTASAPPLQKPSSSQQIPQRLPSTPPKGSGRFIDIDEILDSEDEALEVFSPTPPRIRKLQNSPPLPLAFDREPSAPTKPEAEEVGPTPVFRILASDLEWANLKPSTCASITAHVRTIPPTTDSKKPSWHEKILMYDPIILEDFTAYLNNNTKLRTYKRATQKQIKAYNVERKKKGNAILGVEKDDQVLAIEKELEVYMVRDWCQEMSICCIHAKESRGRGSARKGFY